jgi:FkbM family methyltransferase
MNEFDRWFSDGGDLRYRYDYDLNKDSIVFDVGGYEGTFSKKINDDFGCNIFIFEPMKYYHDLILNKFIFDPNIKVHNFGLSKLTEDIKIFHSGDASSIFKESDSYEIVTLKNISDFINDNNITKIDLLKINIEGSEYDLLERLIECDKLNIIDNIQVQFHSFVPNCVERRNSIREHLRKTHDETYCYEFVWENWKIKNKK